MFVRARSMCMIRHVNEEEDLVMTSQLVWQASRLFEDARARLMQQVTVEGIFDSDRDEDYPFPQSVHCKTHEVQVNAQ